MDTRDKKSSSQRTESLKKRGAAAKENTYTAPEENSGSASDRRDPTTEEWLALFAAGARFKAAEPWKYLWDSDLFGVENPETGVTGYCSVMGRAGMHFALGVYPGPEGMASWEMMAAAGVRGHKLEMEVAGNLQMCLMASWEDQKELSSDDRKLIRDLGLKFRGRNAWPLFQRHEPGYVPGSLDAQEAVFLTAALNQAIHVAQCFREDEEYLIGPAKDDRILVRCLRNLDVATWVDELQSVPPPPELSVDWSDDERQVLAGLPTRPGFVMDLPAGVITTAVTDERGERAYFPYVFMYVDAASQQSLGFEMFTPEAFPREVLSRVVRQLADIGSLPEKIRLSDRYLYRILAAHFSGSSISVQLYQSLPQTEEMFDFIINSLGNG